MSPASALLSVVASTDLTDYQIIKRDGSVVQFDREKIATAVGKAFIAQKGGIAESDRAQVARVTDDVIHKVTTRKSGGGAIAIEIIQDEVEMSLFRQKEFEVARAYILYRSKRDEARRSSEQRSTRSEIQVKAADGSLSPFDSSTWRRIVNGACAKQPGTNPRRILDSASREFYSGITEPEVQAALVLAARSQIETDPRYSYVAAELVLYDLRAKAMGSAIVFGGEDDLYATHFPQAIREGVELELMDPALLSFDLDRLAAALVASRDTQFNYLGIQTIADRYLLQKGDKLVELPQTMFMRIAMGLALRESDKNERAIEFYNLLSSFDFMCSTPTLFNSGTCRSQLSSCYLTTIGDDLFSIYGALQENAMLSKFAGGLGNDWTPVRALGSYIKGTNGESQGIVPFLKVANDTAVAVNQGGKRKGAVCAYLETWHLDIEEFLDLRKNTGDDRRRTHDMNTANWIPDLFMRRVMEGGEWTLFSPSDCPDLHDLYGAAFESAYLGHEARVGAGELKLFKKTPALTLWRKMLSMLFETGHPWITFKDACNIRSPQQHVGVVHSSNLCTEITLNTSAEEIAVCNLGSVNLLAHMVTGEDDAKSLDHAKLQRTITTGMRMLDNVIDINYYSVDKARTSNLRHRPVGLGIMGFQDCLHYMRTPYASNEAVEFADRSMEAVCYFAYMASSILAEERGRYSSYEGSLWDRGILPQDSLDLLREARGGHLEVDRSATMDWAALRTRIKTFGMRNSNCVAIAPTATIANIIGVSASIEPTYQNLYVKSNLSGEFTVVNEFLVRDLAEIGAWDSLMVQDLKAFDGSLSKITRVPAEIRRLYATAFEVDATWLVEAASRRQKWIDQAQSLNIYLAGASGKKLDEIYKFAWVRGLKTTYYLRTLGATSAEKSTGRGGELNAVSSSMASVEADPTFCAIDATNCDACQ